MLENICSKACIPVYSLTQTINEISLKGERQFTVKSALQFLIEDKKVDPEHMRVEKKQSFNNSVHETDNDAENTANSIFKSSTFCHWKEKLSVNVSK